MPSCRQPGNAPGIAIVASSAAGGTLVCTLGNRTDVRHVVIVTNLRRYPATLVICTGSITSNPRKVMFDNTPDAWIGSIAQLPSGRSYPFDHATLLRDRGGQDLVHASVEVHWKRPGGPHTATAAIDVIG